MFDGPNLFGQSHWRSTTAIVAASVLVLLLGLPAIAPVVSLHETGSPLASTLFLPMGNPAAPSHPSVTRFVQGSEPDLDFGAASAGSVVRTAFLNYNSSIPSNFASSVFDWLPGQPMVDPATDQLWTPEWPVSLSVGGLPIPPPRTAPAVVYNPATNSSGLALNLTNTTSLAYDPINGFIYGTDATANTTVVYNPVTGTWAHAPIRVGLDPFSVVFDSASGDLYVANAVSDNVTVINGSTSSIVSSGIPAGTAPFSLVADPKDHRVYAADLGKTGVTYTIWAINTTSNGPGFAAINITSAPSAIAYASGTDLLAVARPAQTFLSVYSASTPSALVTTATVGRDVNAVAENLNGSEFVVSNLTSELTVVNSTSGSVINSHITLVGAPTYLTPDPINNEVYAWNVTFRDVSVVNLASASVGPLSPDLGVLPKTLVYDSSTNRVFVADRNVDSLIVLNATSTSTARPPILTDCGVEALADDASTGTVFAGCSGGVFSLEASTGRIITTGTAGLTGDNAQLLYDSSSGILWDLNNNTGLLGLNPATLAVEFSANVGTGGANVRSLALDNETGDIFVVNPSNATIAEVNGATGQEVVPAIPTAPGLNALAFDPSDGEVYAAGPAVWAIDPTTRSVVAGPIAIGPHARVWSMIYDASRGFLYISTNATDSYTGNLTVLDGSTLATSESGYLTIPVGLIPVDLQSISLPGAGAAGSSEIWVTNFVSGTATILASPPSITFLSASPNPLDVGVSTQVLLGYTGGAGPSSVVYSGLPPGCTSANTTTLDCTPTASGSFDVSVTVSDSLGESASAQTVLSVSPAIGVSETLGPGQPAAVDVGVPMSGAALVSGGTSPFNYTWSLGDATTLWGPSIAHTYDTPGTYLVTVVVRDSGGGSTSSTGSIIVAALPSVSVAATPTNITDVGIPVALSAAVAGGTGPGNSTWTFGDGTTGYGLAVHHTYSKAGLYFAKFVYTDAFGKNATGFVAIEVNGALSATLTSSAGPSGASVTTGTTVTLSTSITGGTSPYTVVWTFDDGSYGYGTSATHSYASSGTYTLTLFVEDNVGAEFNATYRLTVNSPSTSTFGGGFDTGLFLGIVLGAVIAAVVLFAATRSRKRGPPPPTPYVPPAASPPAAAAPAEEPGAAPWQE